MDLATVLILGALGYVLVGCMVGALLLDRRPIEQQVIGGIWWPFVGAVWLVGAHRKAYRQLRPSPNRKLPTARAKELES